MNIIKTISQIISLLLPFAFGISMWVTMKKQKAETLTAVLYLCLTFIGMVSCLLTGLSLFGLE